MPRRETPFFPEQYYHFYNRGNNRRAVFFERANYLYFLHGMKKYLRESMDILAYCLMPTHYHILVRVKGGGQGVSAAKTSAGEAPRQTSEVFKTSDVVTAPGVPLGVETSKAVSLAMQKFGISYTKAINKRFDRVGSLFQGQFKGKPVQTYGHLLRLCVYIHANPVKDGLAALPEDWEFSNYLEWLGLRDGTLVDREFIAENFGAPDDYQKLVMEYIQTRYQPEDVIRYLQMVEG